MESLFFSSWGQGSQTEVYARVEGILCTNKDAGLSWDHRSFRIVFGEAPAWVLMKVVQDTRWEELTKFSSKSLYWKQGLRSVVKNRFSDDWSQDEDFLQIEVS